MVTVQPCRGNSAGLFAVMRQVCREGLTVPQGTELQFSLKMHTVKEICELSGVTRKTLFHYDRIGLLKPTQRIGKQGVKLYDREAVNRLLEIRIYRLAGLPLEEIRWILDGSEHRRTSILQKRLNVIGEEMELLEEQKNLSEQLNLLKPEVMRALLNRCVDLNQLKQEILAYRTGED